MTTAIHPATKLTTGRPVLGTPGVQMQPKPLGLVVGHPFIGVPVLMEIYRPLVILERDEQRGPGMALFSKSGNKWWFDVEAHSLVGNPTNARRDALNIKFIPPLSLDADAKIRYDNTANVVAIEALRVSMQAQINTLTASLAAETTTRAAADSTEAATRAAADSTEAATRAAADLTFQPIPTSSSDYRVGAVIPAYTGGAIADNATTAGSNLRLLGGGLLQLYYDTEFPDGIGGTVTTPNNPIYRFGGADGQFIALGPFVVGTGAVAGTWKNISGGAIPAGGIGVFVRVS